MSEVAFWRAAWRADAKDIMVADRLLEEETAALKPGRALDLGCGNGANALQLAAAGWAVTGIDCSGQAIGLARAASRERRLTAEFLVGDVTDWQPAPCHELVISTYALPGGERRRKALRTAMRALRPGGLLLVAEWEQAMSARWGIPAEELATPAEIVRGLAGLHIERAEVRRIPDMFADGDARSHAGAEAQVAFVRAHRPR